MSCNCRANSPYAKSCIRTYNNTVQPFTEALTTLNLEGTPVVDSGCSLSLNGSSVSINKSGLYHLTADVTYTATGAGVAVVQLYQNGVAMPCAISQQTVAAADVNTAHVETDICAGVCCANRPVITVAISGVAGDVNHVCFGALKLA